jgi:hypothetical protein
MVSKRSVLALVLTGCAVAASAFVVRRHSRQRRAQQHKDDLRNWEGEGGKPASPALHPAPAD